MINWQTRTRELHSIFSNTTHPEWSGCVENKGVEVTTEQYQIGYEEGYQEGWNAAMSETPLYTALSAEPTWCNGCTPENCFGCHIPSNEQAILKAAPTPLSERDDTELIQTVLEVFETLAERLPENRSTIKTCYAINDLDRDRVHLMVNLLRKRLENK